MVKEKKTIRCHLDQRWLFDTTSTEGCVEIKCMKCKNIIKVNFDNYTLEYPKLNIVTAMSN